ncbi:DEAD/DEAH box helicase family protein [Streptomyces sp900116325]|uniref:DEAD/DEAH box helicase family protein n=1 Tax=Streptomyces sp. 900116325 TaxID=3154295 RepID=A0ABV2U776_9ACTN
MSIPYDADLVEHVAHTLDLRAPNHAALNQLARELDIAADGTEMIADLATGVGKTYVAGALLDYLHESGVRNVVVVTPGSTIQNKTVTNLTPGHPKYLRGLQSNPMVITLDTLERGDVGNALEEIDRFKVFVFTVQSLLRPNTRSAYRAHRPHETLGQTLYEYLRAADDLVVIADEHHVYFSGNAKKFQKAISDMSPLALIGLTATPHDATRDKVVYHYPLSEAIADGYVKIPVLVSRQDNVSDLRTQMADGVALLNAKATAMRTFCDSTRKPYIEPILFVVAQTIEEATSLRDMLAAPDFLDGEEAVLLVTSDEPDATLALLETLESPGSPIRAVVSVSMLKEGWDVKNIYVIAAVRAMESQLLTEQILGRGMRLPFGSRTGNPMLDTVEVLSHRSFTSLLKQAKALLEQTLGERATQGSIVVNPTIGKNTPGIPMDGLADIPSQVLNGEVSEIEIRLPGPAATDLHQPGLFDVGGFDRETHVGISLATVASRVVAAEASTTTLTRRLTPRSPGGIKIPLYLPHVTTRWERDPFSLTQINHADVEALGRQFSEDDAPTLTRKALDAERDEQGRVRSLITDQTDAVIATQTAIVFDTIETDLVKRLLSTNGIAATVAEANAAASIARAFLAGAEVTQQTPWRSEHGRLATARLSEWIATLQTSSPAREVREVTHVRWPDPTDRVEARPPADRHVVGNSREFMRGYPYDGWTRSVYEVNAFDAYSTEFGLATLFETSPGVRAWVRINETVPIRITYLVGAIQRQYEPDFVVIDDVGTYWLIEGKADSEMSNVTVLAKRDAARAWISTVNGSQEVQERWGYILASESVIASASTWVALKSGAQTYR